MLARLREYIRNESLGITVPVGVVLGEGLRGLIYYVVFGFETTHSPKATFLGIGFYWTAVLAETISIVVVALTAYILFFMPIGETRGPDEQTRACPECKSEIAADARRCAFCTSQVEPIAT